MRSTSTRVLATAGIGIVLAALISGCGVPVAAAPPDGPQGASGSGPLTMRVGYFANLTHSQALVGMARGDFQQALGPGVQIETNIFNSGPSAVEALFAGQLDLAYVGPNPSINGYVQSNGQALRVVAGASSGGAALVVRPEAGIAGPEDLAGKKLATPQIGNTQDVALRAYLEAHGLKTKDKGGQVEIIPTDNAQILSLFRRGQLDGAWVPEPWASRLILEGGGKIFLDERDLWPEGDFVTADIVVSKSFLTSHPELVRQWLGAHVSVTQWELTHPYQAKQVVNSEIKRLTGQTLAPQVIDEAWSRMRVTYDPLPATLIKSADAAYRAGYLKQKPDLSGIFDLTLLNQVLDERKLPEVR